MKARVVHLLGQAGFGWAVPLVLLGYGEAPREQFRALWTKIGLPLLALGIFLLLWAAGARQVDTSLGQLPGPAQTWEQYQGLHAEHLAERQRAEAFYQRQEERNARKREKDPEAELRWRDYTGAPTFYDQILTSLKTVFVGFVLAAIIAIPLGVACGLSPSLNAALSPLIQVLKPIPPLAWLPIVTMVVSAVYVSPDPAVAKSFINSAITVTLCSLWPTLINTAVGVSSIDRDLINVGRVINLPLHARVLRIAVPASLPMIFTGLRISLGIGWMVLIASEMLAQNPGLGKFVWDEFQNGSSNSLGRILVAVIVIGLIGFLLDWLMLTLQRLVSYEPPR